MNGSAPASPRYRSGKVPGLATVLILSCFTLPGFSSDEAASAKRSRWEWNGVPRVVAAGDVHGSYDKLVTLLRGTGLVNRDLAWAGATDHFVLCGDLIDRGPDDGKVLDLVRRLQQEALAAGGRVHVVLGNHEIMNMTRDMRYVAPESYAAFAGDEAPGERQAGWASFRAAYSRKGHDAASARRAFEERFPPGYFARVRAFGPEGEYGSWLLTLPAVVKVNGFVFLHGGLTPEVAALGLDEINRRVARSIRKFIEYSEALAGEVTGPATFSVIYSAATELSESKKSSAKVTAARGLVQEHDALPFAPDGPLWYRADSLENERILRVQVGKVLELLDARAVVVGHTPTAHGQVTSRFDNRIYRCDVGMVFGGPPSAWVLEDDRVRVFIPATLSYVNPVAESPEGQDWSGIHEELPDLKLERFLAKAKITNRSGIERAGRTFLILQLQRRGHRLRAVAARGEQKLPEDAGPDMPAVRRYQHGLAAYRLDRMLGLRMVPVTVARTIDGQPGVIQVWLETAIDLPYLQTSGHWELIKGLEDQITRARIFSALIDVHERLDAAKMLLPHERRIMISDNSMAFSLSPEVQQRFLSTRLEGVPDDIIRALPCDQMGAALEHALASLDKQALQSNLGEYLSAAQIDALLHRRDRILEACSAE